MPKYIVDCAWKMYGCFEVEATSKEAAQQTVENGEGPYSGLPCDDEYQDGSFEITGVREVKQKREEEIR